ncbi:hypothetical protein AAFF_G00401790 [Aldrovandia affinis]|uniref:Uncharacterized protein n=1 Tax=Aldrovandia affinis TaxID=143900 RepID=A0AAD7VYR8_9TELE|nr:hypothetical protein AAFF_G00401790 [Aldrovandia affinis]
MRRGEEQEEREEREEGGGKGVWAPPGAPCAPLWRGPAGRGSARQRAPAAAPPSCPPAGRSLDLTIRLPARCVELPLLDEGGAACGLENGSRKLCVQKFKFFLSDFTYNPQFEYRHPVPSAMLDRYNTASDRFLTQAVRILEKVLIKYGSYERFELVTGGNLLSKRRVKSQVKKCMEKEGYVGEASRADRSHPATRGGAVVLCEVSFEDVGRLRGLAVTQHTQLPHFLLDQARYQSHLRRLIISAELCQCRRKASTMCCPSSHDVAMHSGPVTPFL